MRSRRRTTLFAVFGVIILLALAAFLWRNRPRRVIELGPPEIRMTVWRVGPSAPQQNPALYEPATGCLLGAYIDLDSTLKRTYRDNTKNDHKLPEEFESVVGKKHALYFFYLGYGQKLPIDWVKKLAAEGKYVQIALEPNDGLGKVKEDAYLDSLADQIKASGAKVFLRFASEMNGDWVNYHGHPKLYIEKWRLITKVMRQRAPNVAMLWCPYVTPQKLIAEYYPGDEYVDWVGENLYSVTYYNMDRRFPGLKDHPADLLRIVYDKFADRKPIMICEYGAANYSATEKQKTTKFAEECIASLYASLPYRFPRVKCVTYFDCNNMQLADKMNNDYRVTADPDILDAYSKAINSPYFLGDAKDTAPVIEPVGDNVLVDQPMTFGCWARSPGRMVTIRLTIDGKIVQDQTVPGVVSITLNPHSASPGKHSVLARAFNEDHIIVASQQATLEFPNAKP